MIKKGLPGHLRHQRDHLRLQAVLIPPSHNMVITSLAAGGSVSIAHLFVGGVIPGLIFGLCLIALCLVMSYRRGYPRDEPVTLRQAGKIALDAFWGLGTVVIILGGILSGVFTATESAAVACTPSSSRCSSTGTTSGETCRA
jgi:TRAP-type C4-dicarboxylate transport system permease large subunit